MNPLETYFKDLRDIRATGAAVAETSFYPVLSNLLNEIGKTLKPKVRCVINPANTGAGLPDGGLFTADQFQRGTDAAPQAGQLPARGVLEVKGPADDVAAVARSEQVKRYSARYGLVLVTNYRDFLLLGRDAGGNPLPQETYTLADSEAAFWQAARHPEKSAKAHGERFCEYIKRVMLSVAPLSAPQDVAWFLASYARDARDRVEDRKDLSTLAAVREALEEALGMKFAGEKGEHFFRSTLVQTIFYGVFSAWVLWHRERPDRTDAFDWRTSAWSLRVPFIRALYDEIATPSKLGPLGLVEVLDWTAAALSRVNRAAFFQRFQDEHAVQYFYEPFLEAFDPDLRKEMGVWYTPPEIVQYQVARVDAVLREELGLADGLADPNVIVLDPCCGTGAYLVEVLRHIADTLKAKGDEALIASDLKKAAMTRVFGFEILPAPFVVAHLQLGLLLHSLGAPLSAKGNERVGVYLTNALTGWEPPKEPKQRVLEFMRELQQERDAADQVKRQAKILVVLGNPPYNAFAGVSPDEEQGLVEPYKKDLNKPVAKGGWGIRKFNLDDLYIRFFRLAERRIAEMTGRGVVSFISNHSWIAEPSFVVLRKHLLKSFDKFWIENLHGNRKISEYAPDGRTSETIFAIQGFSPGIQQGVATSLWVKTGKPRKAGEVAEVFHRDDLNEAKAVDRRRQLLSSLNATRFGAKHKKGRPSDANRFSFRPESVPREYGKWASVLDLCAIPPLNGPVERRGNSLIVMPQNRADLHRVADFLDSRLTDEEVRSIQPAFMRSGGEYDAPSARNGLKGKVHYRAGSIVRYPFKPLDNRLAYLDPDIQPLFSRPSPQLLAQRFEENAFFITRDTADKAPEGPPFFFSNLVCDYDCISGHARHFPIRLMNGQRLKASQHATLFNILGERPDVPAANLSKAVRVYLDRLKIKDPDRSAESAGLVWLHALAIGYSPAYLGENADGIRRDWPRVPLPAGRKALEESAALGRQVAALLDTEADVRGVTASPVEPIFRTVGVLTRGEGVSPLRPTGVSPVEKKKERGQDALATQGRDGLATRGQDSRDTQLDADAGDLAVTAGWGHAGKEGVTMPGAGRIVQRPFDAAELEAIAQAAQARGLSAKAALALLGPDTRDVYLNERAYWRNVPAGVWEYFIGGYQVVKKWLSYREQALLGRPLRAEEAREVTGMVRRLAAIILLQPALDANNRECKAHAYAWPGA